MHVKQYVIRDLTQRMLQYTDGHYTRIISVHEELDRVTRALLPACCPKPGKHPAGASARPRRIPIKSSR